MGKFINKGNEWFKDIVQREYVDKSGLISVVNNTLCSEFRFSCVTRCRRFGKSLAAKMLVAYYDRSCDSHELFKHLKIASDPSFETHLNKYPVIYLDMTAFVSKYKDATVVQQIEKALIEDIHNAYSDIPLKENSDLMDLLLDINEARSEQFIFIIDEWDAICREFDPKTKAMEDYLNWLRRMFKSSDGLTAFAGVYMTGILPIKKYNTQSALNNFKEYSMVKPGKMASFFGFTKEEVRQLAEKHSMDFGELEKWYDGYQIGKENSMFNPNSVMMALDDGECSNNWASTGAYDAVSGYITRNFGGLKDDVIFLLAGGRVKVKTSKFGNDMADIKDRNDVLTLLIHLGYLAYDWSKNACYVPNLEVAEELSSAVEDSGWTNVAYALQNSETLLEDTLRGNAAAVATAIDVVHSEQTSILSYNDENSLACVLSIAFYCARKDYIIHREFPSGYGFADLVFSPRPNVDKPAIIIELKQGHSAEEAILQIRERKYVDKVRQRTPHILLVGINYDPDSKHHTCIIEKA